MNRTPKLYLVMYDIRDPERWRDVYPVVRSYGDRLQYSVFRCILTPKQLAEMVDRLMPLIHHGEDQVLFVPLGSVEAQSSWEMTTLGQPLPPVERGVKIF